VDWAIQRAREHDRVEAVADKFSTPSYTLDLGEMLQRLIANEEAAGVVHLTNGGSCSWQEYAQWAIDCCQAEGMALRANVVGKISLADMKNFVARRPVHTTLATAKYERLTGHQPRHWRDAVADFVRTKFASELGPRG
jgi:dTDP-4-dehydrorhamnose reductase